MSKPAAMDKPAPMPPMWNGTGWTHYKRWENFTKQERLDWFEKHPKVDEPPDKSVQALPYNSSFRRTFRPKKAKKGR